MAQPILYFENAMASIYAHLGGYALLRYHPGARTLADVHQILTYTGQLLAQRGWHKLFSDQRLLSPFTEDEQALILDFWQARHFTHGPTLGAVLLSQDVFTRLSFHAIREQAYGALRYQVFEDEAEAASWLQQISTLPS
ncbi:hypothetical protein DNI29_17690 [Hymenobacter sediminis]|uniref:hypothetical protein n=1 Tax=Hymenobacter sediminis TaxID=2218621 RepID=UPI000DA67746|nr:hypothetical protein [Hymenobacter sediminis]RPD45225.1 hypothetical protein DNI29_17690 [Hymenobacter sediminis]